jgi:hypothetical protein
MLTAHGLRTARRSHGEPVTHETDVYLADTMGELGLFYRLAGIAFIGGSLVAKGGHNPFEAARLDCAVVYGPYISNCAGMAGDLAVARASETVSDGDALARAISTLLPIGASEPSASPPAGGSLPMVKVSSTPYRFGLPHGSIRLRRWRALSIRYNACTPDAHRPSLLGGVPRASGRSTAAARRGMGCHRACAPRAL